MVPVAVLLSLQINGAGHSSADMQCMSTANPGVPAHLSQEPQSRSEAQDLLLLQDYVCNLSHPANSGRTLYITGHDWDDWNGTSSRNLACGISGLRRDISTGDLPYFHLDSQIEKNLDVDCPFFSVQRLLAFASRSRRSIACCISVNYLINAVTLSIFAEGGQQNPNWHRTSTQSNKPSRCRWKEQTEKSKNSRRTKEKPHQNNKTKNQTKQKGKVNGWSVANVSSWQHGDNLLSSQGLEWRMKQEHNEEQPRRGLSRHLLSPTDM